MPCIAAEIAFSLLCGPLEEDTWLSVVSLNQILLGLGWLGPVEPENTFSWVTFAVWSKGHHSNGSPKEPFRGEEFLLQHCWVDAPVQAHRPPLWTSDPPVGHFFSLRLDLRLLSSMPRQTQKPNPGHWLGTVRGFSVPCFPRL